MEVPEKNYCSNSERYTARNKADLRAADTRAAIRRTSNEEMQEHLVLNIWYIKTILRDQTCSRDEVKDTPPLILGDICFLKS